jgi:hypothetical protein
MSRRGLSPLVVVLWIVTCLVSLGAGLFLGSTWDKNTGGSNIARTRKSPTAATAVLQVRAAQPRIFPVDDAKVDWKEFEFYRANLAAAIKSMPVIDSALNDKSLAALPIVKQHGAEADDWLSDAIEVDVPANSEFMSVTINSGEKNQSRTLVNAVVNAFIREIVEKETYEHRQRRDSLEKQLNGLTQRILDKKRQFDELSRQIGTSDSEAVRVKKRIAQEEVDSLLHRRSDLEKGIADLDLKIKMAEMRGKDVESAPVSEDDVEVALSKDPRLMDAMTALADLKDEQKGIEKVVKDKAKDPAAARIRDAISVKLKEIDGIKSDRRQKVAEAIKRQEQTSAAALQLLQGERALLVVQMKEVNSQIDTQAENMQKLEKFNGDADQLRAEIEQEEGIAKQMADALMRSNVELGAESRVKVASLAD